MKSDETNKTISISRTPTLYGNLYSQLVHVKVMAASVFLVTDQIDFRLKHYPGMATASRIPLGTVNISPVLGSPWHGQYTLGPAVAKAKGRGRS